MLCQMKYVIVTIFLAKLYKSRFWLNTISVCKCFVLYALSQEPLKLPGRMTRLKNFKTPFFSRCPRFLPLGS